METKQVKLPVEVADRLLDIKDMEERGALVARALSAPPEPLGEAAAAEEEPKVRVALPERGERVPGSPDTGSPSVTPKIVWSTGRSGLGEPVEWEGATIHLPPDCQWFLDLDDASRTAAVRASLSRARDRREERAELFESISNPEGHTRPSHMPKSWEPVTVWVPAWASVWEGTIQDHVEQSLGADRSAALLAEVKKAGGKS